MKLYYYRISIFYGLDKWHELIYSCILPLFTDNSPSFSFQCILYLSTFRGDSINITFILNNQKIGLIFVNQFKKEVCDFLIAHPTLQSKNRIHNIKYVFKNFSNDTLYYGLHGELINNFSAEGKLRDFRSIQNIISKIVINQLSKEQIDNDTLLSFTLWLYILVDISIELKKEELKDYYQKLFLVLVHNSNGFEPHLYLRLNNTLQAFLTEIYEDLFFKRELASWVEEFIFTCSKLFNEIKLKNGFSTQFFHFKLITIINSHLGINYDTGAFLTECMRTFYLNNNINSLYKE